MPKNTNKAKEIGTNFDLTYCQNTNQTTKLKPSQRLFDRTYSNLTFFFFNKKTLKYFNDFPNRSFSVL